MQDADCRLRGERVPPRSHFIQDDAQGENVGGRLDRVAASLLRRHVPRGPDQRPRDRGFLRGEQPRQAEVQHLDVPVMTDHHVLRLDVAVDDSAGVSHAKGARQLPSELWHGRNHGALQQGIAQGSTRHVLHDDKASFGRHANVEHGDDVRVVERRGGARFRLKAGRSLRLSGGRGQQFKRDLASQAGVGGQIDVAHSSRSQKRVDRIVTDLTALREARRPGRGCRRGRQERPGVLVRAEQGFHFLQEADVFRAGGKEERAAALAIEIRRLVEDVRDALVTARCHRAPFRLSSRNSQARARLQSRRTVPTETFRASAVSSRLRPPK